MVGVNYKEFYVSLEKFGNVCNWIQNNNSFMLCKMTVFVLHANIQYNLQKEQLITFR